MLLIYVGMSPIYFDNFVCSSCSRFLTLLSLNDYFEYFNRTNMDPLNNCVQMACTEIRAENLSGECEWIREWG